MSYDLSFMNDWDFIGDVGSGSGGGLDYMNGTPSASSNLPSYDWEAETPRLGTGVTALDTSNVSMADQERIAEMQANAAEARGFDGFGVIPTAESQASGLASVLKSLGIDLGGMSDKSKDRLTSGAITAGGLLLKSIADQSLARRQVQAAKDIKAQDNQYQIDAEKRLAERAKWASTAKEDWGFSKTGLLDAAMRQQRSK